MPQCDGACIIIYQSDESVTGRKAHFLAIYDDG